ncbi:hypothetical protein BC332_24815 [Capsicum chinense]|nr:hypothetical protein BC332_24815 [Capsicum chinense]
MTDFEVEVKEVASAAEHAIQLSVTEVVLGENKIQKKKAHRRFHQSLQQIAKDMDRIWTGSTKIQDKGKKVSKESLVHEFSSSTNDILKVKNNMVGRDDQMKRLLKDLTRSCSDEPKVIPIVGMGGIGKTTLAEEVYNHKPILCHFDVHAWATVSQQHNKKEILLGLLHSTIKMDDTVKMKSEAELADKLQKSLKRTRYLIVLDDIWSCEVWDGLTRCFPTEDNAGSRILLTTRNNELACYADTENLSLWMNFMDQDESWSLFKSAAFSSEALPYEFETVGKQIADECHGLPLTIVMVAGLLKSKRAIEDWESVAKDVTSFVTNDPDEQCSRVLGLSYSHLTSDLKTCLLYFGTFPEDTEIPVKHLMRLWMAEGFLNSEKDLEGEAEKCLQDLVDRCLVLVSKRSRDETKIRSCKVHDLIYNLCLREIQRGNVFTMNDVVFEKPDDCEPAHVSSGCHSLSRMYLIVFEHLHARKAKSLSMHKMNPFKCWTPVEMFNFGGGFYRALLTPVHRQLRDQDNNDLLKQTRSIFFDDRGISTLILKSELTHFKLLKVLDVSHVRIDSFPLQILSLIWLRYLSLQLLKNLDIPSEICRLWNLQTFIVKGPTGLVITLPEEIWGLMQLRHLKVISSYRQNPLTISIHKGSHVGSSNLQTTSYLSSCCCTKLVFSRIQNVKKLGFRGNNLSDSGLHNNLVYLQQLEILSFIRCSCILLPVTSAKAFPATLKKLNLESTYLDWSYMNIIAELPNLEVLKLMDDACDGEEWHPNVKGFTRLKLLLIEDNRLKYWKATEDKFPVLERLVLRGCYHLKEIPIEFADIHTLQLIELTRCLPELGESAARIKKEQKDLGNDHLDVCISNPCKYMYLSGHTLFLVSTSQVMHKSYLALPRILSQK